MAKKTRIAQNLTEFFKLKHFTRIETIFRKHFRLGLQTLDIKGDRATRMCSRDCEPKFCKLIQKSSTATARCHQDRLRSLNIAFETGQPYISLCHAGIVLVCVPIMEKDIPLGGLFFGKCMWEPVNMEIEADVMRRLRGIRLDRTNLSMRRMICLLCLRERSMMRRSFCLFCFMKLPVLTHVL